jgi:cell division protein FtsB
MGNKERIAKWRKLHKRTKLSLTHEIAGLMLDMLEQQQAEIDRLTKDNERLENEVEDLVYLAMGEYI